MAGERAGGRDLDALDRVAREAHREPAELLGERDERPDDGHLLLADLRDVERVRDRAARRAPQRPARRPACRRGPAPRRSRRRGAGSRRRSRARAAASRRQRLLLEHVERGAVDGPSRSASTSASVSTRLAARGVDQPRARAHARERVARDQVVGLGGQRQVQRDEVGRRVDLVERRGRAARRARGSARASRAGRRPGCACRARGRRRRRAGRCGRSRARRASCPSSSTPAEARALPAALHERRVRLRHVARDGQQQRDRVLGRRDDVRLRRVADEDAAAGGRGDVDVVDADARPADHAQARGVPISSASTCVAERTTSAVVVADPRRAARRGRSRSPSSTSPAARSISSRPGRAARRRGSGAGRRRSRCGVRCGAELDLRAASRPGAQVALGDRPELADAPDLADERALPAGDDDAVAVARAGGGRRRRRRRRAPRSRSRASTRGRRARTARDPSRGRARAPSRRAPRCAATRPRRPPRGCMSSAASSPSTSGDRRA